MSTRQCAVRAGGEQDGAESVAPSAKRGQRRDRDRPARFPTPTRKHALLVEHVEEFLEQSLSPSGPVPFAWTFCVAAAAFDLIEEVVVLVLRARRYATFHHEDPIQFPAIEPNAPALHTRIDGNAGSIYLDQAIPTGWAPKGFPARWTCGR